MSAPTRRRERISWLIVVLMVLFAWWPAAGQGGDEVPPPRTTGSLTAMEYSAFGGAASTIWRTSSPSGDAIGGVGGENQGVAGLGRKTKAGFLSLLIPGAGQFYNGQKGKALVFFGVEVAIWASYFTFDTMGDNRSETYQEYAGIYAGTGGEHNDRYWQAVGRHMDSDAYNESVRREARAAMEDPQGLISEADAWQWRNEGYLQNYQELRADANRAYDRRDFTILFAIVNRAVSVVDAVRNAVGDRLSAHVLGFDVALEVSPSLSDPRTACTVQRRF